MCPQRRYVPADRCLEEPLLWQWGASLFGCWLCAPAVTVLSRFLQMPLALPSGSVATEEYAEEAQLPLCADYCANISQLQTHLSVTCLVILTLALPSHSAALPAGSR